MSRPSPARTGLDPGPDSNQIQAISTGYDTLKNMEPIDVAIRDESIRLGQFLKLANLVESGGLAKELIAEGQVSVNGEVDTRRGKVLRPGDVVSVAGMSARVATADEDFDPEKWRNL